MTKKRLIQLLAVVGLIFVILQGMNAMSKPAAPLGVVDERLADCPNKPNCVLSQAAEGQHAIAPFSFEGDPSDTWRALRRGISNYPRTTIITDSDDYLHCHCRSAIMRYVDDVEFLMDAANQVIHFRSASRLGYSDMGANRKRMEEIRLLLAAEWAQ